MLALKDSEGLIEESEAKIIKENNKIAKDDFLRKG